MGDLKRLQAEGLVDLKGDHTIQNGSDTCHFKSLGF